MALTNWSSFDIFISKTRCTIDTNLYGILYFIYRFICHLYPRYFFVKFFIEISLNVSICVLCNYLKLIIIETLYTNGSFSIRNEWFLVRFTSFFVYSIRKVWIISINKYHIAILSNIYIYNRNCLLYLFLYIVWSWQEYVEKKLTRTIVK